MIPAIMRHFLQIYGIALLAGGLLAMAFPSWDLWPLAWLAPALLVWRMAPMTPGAAAAQCFAAGYVFHLLVLHWLTANIMWGGGWATVGYLLICIPLALFWGVLGAVWAWVRKKCPRLGGALTLAIFWVVLELIHARIFTGFGWTALAYSQGVNLVFLQWAAVGGVALVAFFMVLFAALLGLALRESRLRWPRLAGAVLLLVLTHTGGTLLLGDASYAKRLRTGLVQPAYAQELKFRGLAASDLKDQALRLSLAHFSPGEIDLLVWPEATLLYDPATAPTRGEIGALASELGAFLFSGSVRSEEGRGYNSSVLVGSGGGLLAQYDKVHLVPFGEYMPFAEYLTFLRQIVPADAHPGGDQMVLPLRDDGEDLGRALGPLICFEVLYAHMAEELRALGADVLVVVTNLAWFGRSTALAQELELGRLRAIETRLPLIHAANSGISGVFDPYGRFTGMLHAQGYHPRITANHRAIDAFDVAAPAKRPVPWAPAQTPWLFCAAAIGIVTASGVLGRAKRETA
jgi:apolipoprotein N-acyltransferase